MVFITIIFSLLLTERLEEEQCRASIKMRTFEEINDVGGFGWLKWEEKAAKSIELLPNDDGRYNNPERT